jgi:YegS/Rv2252/BmrU family lipid kinase
MNTKVTIKNNPKEAVFIINPVSGVGEHSKRKAEILSIAKDLGWRGKVHETTKTRNAGMIATEEMNNGYKHIVVCGGDGTIMEALQAIINTDVVLGIVPLGTGNLFAQNLEITGSRKEMVEQALYGKKQKVDVGRANETIFAIIAGIGFDAEVMKNAKREMKDKFGFLAYLFTGLQRLNRKSSVYRITIDKKPSKVYRARSIMVANMGKLQGGIEAVPDAHSQNGLLRIGIVRASGLPAWLSLLGNAVMGNINKSPHYTLLEGQKIAIESLKGPKHYQCDGNLFPPTQKLSVEIYPKAVTVLVSEKPKSKTGNPFATMMQFKKFRQ